MALIKAGSQCLYEVLEGAGFWVMDLDKTEGSSESMSVSDG